MIKLTLLVTTTFLFSCYTNPNNVVNLAGDYFNKGEISTSIKLLEKGIVNNTSNKRMYYNVGNFHLAIGNYTKAENYLSVADSISVKNNFNFNHQKYFLEDEIRSNLAFIKILTGKYESSIKLAQTVYKPPIDKYQPLMSILYGYIFLENADSTKKYFERYQYNCDNLTRVFLKNVINGQINKNALLLYLRAYSSNGNHKKGLKLIGDAQVYQKEEPVLLKLKEKYQDPNYKKNWVTERRKRNELGLAQQEVYRGNFKKAEKILRGLENYFKDSEEYYSTKAMLYKYSNRVPVSTKIYKEMITKNKNCSSCYYNLGHTYFKTAKKDSAYLFFNKSLDINPYYPESHFLLASLYESDSNYREAIKNLKFELEINDNNTKALYNLGYYQLKNKEYNEALNSFNELIIIDLIEGSMGRVRARLYKCIATYFVKGKKEGIDETKRQIEWMDKKIHNVSAHIKEFEILIESMENDDVEKEI